MKRTKQSNDEIFHSPKRKFQNRYISEYHEDDNNQPKAAFKATTTDSATPSKNSAILERTENAIPTGHNVSHDNWSGKTHGNDLTGKNIVESPTVLQTEERGKENEDIDAEIVVICDNEKENCHSGIEDTDEECSKDNESRYSESDPGDKSYRINVGLYGTDFDEDSTRDEGESLTVPSNKHPDLNNNQPSCSVARGQGIGFVGIEPSKQVSVIVGLQDDRSNTVDGSTRRALESQCMIDESQNSRINQASTLQPSLHKAMKNSYDYKVNEDDPSYTKSIALALRQAIAEDTAKRTSPTLALRQALDEDTVKRTSPNVIGQPYGTFYQHSQNDQYIKGGTPNLLSPRFAGAPRYSSMMTQNSQYNRVRTPSPRFGVPQRSSTITSQNDQYNRVSTPNFLSPRFGVTPRSATMTSPLNVDENIAAEQIASELVQTYSGKNSHMITDILRRKTGGGQYINNNLGTVEQRQYEDLTASQNVIHDVDLLNTPQQLTPVDQESPSNQCYIQGNDYPDRNFGNRNTLSTPEPFRHAGRAVYQTLEPFHHNTSTFQGKMMYNDIQVYGSKWSAKLRSQGQPGYNDGCSENPLPRPLHYTVNESPSAYINRFPMQEGANASSTQSGVKVPTTYDYKQFNLDTHLHKFQSPPPVYSKGGSGYQLDCAYPLSPDPLGLVGMVGSCPRPAHEVTQMTYTPKEMMESHLSGNTPIRRDNKGVSQSSIPRTQFSSIYPPKEYIDQPFVITTDDSEIVHTIRPKPPKKRYRPSKYDQLPFRGPTMLPPDDMISKYPLPPEAESMGARHKYIVNPSNLKEVSPKTLITKYIDYLIVENEQITDISQSPGAPEDIYVTEDMDFMDTLKQKGQFPSEKFREWVRNFYPRLEFDSLKFKGQSSVTKTDPEEVQIDLRPTQQVLEDTFYFFQRTLMNFKEANVP